MQSFFQINFSIGTVGNSIRLACGRLGVRRPAAKDPSSKIGSDSPTAKRSARGVSVRGVRGKGSSEMIIINRCSSLLNGHEC